MHVRASMHLTFAHACAHTMRTVAYHSITQHTIAYNRLGYLSKAYQSERAGTCMKVNRSTIEESKELVWMHGYANLCLLPPRDIV